MTRSCGAPTVSGPLFSRSVLACAGYCTMIEAERKSECLAICRDLSKDADVFLAFSWVTAVSGEREVAYDKTETDSPYAFRPSPHARNRRARNRLGAARVAGDGLRAMAARSRWRVSPDRGPCSALSCRSRLPLWQF